MSRQADARTGARISLPSIPQSGCNRRSCAPQLATSMRAIRGGEDRPSRSGVLCSLVTGSATGLGVPTGDPEVVGLLGVGEGSTAQRRNRPGLGSHTRGHLRQPVHLRSPLSSGRQASRPYGAAHTRAGEAAVSVGVPSRCLPKRAARPSQPSPDRFSPGCGRRPGAATRVSTTQPSRGAVGAVAHGGGYCVAPIVLCGGLVPLLDAIGRV